MALDEALLLSVARGESPPVLRVYSWKAPAVSLGYNQDCRKELNLESCAAHGVEVVRRPTGGRSVYHARELTYSLAGPADTAELGRTISETCRLVGGALRRSLALLGVKADPEKNPRGNGSAGRAGLGRACFTSVSRFEITVEGKKLVGSAQKRLGDNRAFLQQGSLLIENSQARLAELLPGPANLRERERLARFLQEEAVGLAELPGGTGSFEALAGAFRRGFAEFFGCELIEDRPDESETRLAEKLAREKYSSREWLLAREKSRVTGSD